MLIPDDAIWPSISMYICSGEWDKERGMSTDSVGSLPVDKAHLGQHIVAHFINLVIYTGLVQGVTPVILYHQTGSTFELCILQLCA